MTLYVREFKTSQTFEPPPELINSGGACWALLVAGGGGGGGGACGGAGGAGEVRTIPLTLTEPTLVIIGAGGAAGTGLPGRAGTGGATQLGSLAVSGGGGGENDSGELTEYRSSGACGGGSAGGIRRTAAGSVIVDIPTGGGGGGMASAPQGSRHSTGSSGQGYPGAAVLTRDRQDRLYICHCATGGMGVNGLAAGGHADQRRPPIDNTGNGGDAGQPGASGLVRIWWYA